MILVPLLFFVIPALAGSILLISWQVLNEKGSTAVVGSTAGIASFVTIAFLITTVIPFGVAATLPLLGILATVAIYVGYTKNAWQKWQALPFDRTVPIIFTLLLVLFFFIAPKLLIHEDDGIYTGVLNAYGDVAWHMSNITNFAAGQTLPPENPILADTRLTYPFLTNVFSAILLTAGATYSESVTLPALLLIPLLLTSLYILTRDIVSPRRVTPLARTAGIIAMILFLAGGATLGWLRFGESLQESGLSVGEFLLNLPEENFTGHGGDPNGYHFINPVISLLLPQRSFLFGFPLAAAIILLLLRSKQSTETSYVTAGILAGLLPLFHAHTVLALIPIIIVVFLDDVIQESRGHKRSQETHNLAEGKRQTKPWAVVINRWLLFVLPAAIIGLPEILYYVRGTHEGQSFLRFGPGWTAGSENLLTFWLKNTGLLIPVVLVGLFLPAPHRIKTIALAAGSVFIIANLFLFAPWPWDNFKLLIFWFLFSLPLVGWTAAYFLKKKSSFLVSTLVLALIGMHILAGALDIWKLALPTAPQWLEWDQEEIAIAAQIKQHTKPGESIIAAPIHDSPLALAGRAAYLGFPGHVWSHGANPFDREAAIKEFYAGTRSDLPETDPEYILVGPLERTLYPTLTIQPTWELVTETDTYQLYQLPAPSARN